MQFMRTAWARALAAPAGVAAATVLMRLAGASHTVAALVYVVVVVAAAFLGPVPAALAVLGAFFAENYFFTPPRGTLRIANGDDVVALVVFGVTATVVSTAVLRVNELRRRAAVREREARLRLELTEQLLAGADPHAVLVAGQAALARLFNLDDCVIDVASGSASIAPSTPGDRDVIDAFARGIATSIERVRLDREIESARVDAALQSSRAAFLSAMTHNLRTPLATIKASVSTLLAPAPLDVDSRADLLVTARREVERLERLVTKVLQLSRIRSGAVVVERESVDLTELVANAVRSVWGLAVERDVRVVRSGEPAPAVSVDPTLLDVAVACLVENALRYAPAGSEVAVTSAARDGRGEIRVVDHGPGVPMAERATLFDEFVRGEGVHDAAGAGIGLTIARAFVAAHAGTVTIEDTPGGGATFVISLPA